MGNIKDGRVKFRKKEREREIKGTKKTEYATNRDKGGKKKRVTMTHKNCEKKKDNRKAKRILHRPSNKHSEQTLSIR